MNVIKSEWIKLSTTKSIWWTSALIILFSAGFAAMNGLGVSMMVKSSEESNSPDEVMDPGMMMDVAGVKGAISGMMIFGMMIVIIQAVINVTSEYSTGTSKSTVLATPKRVSVPLAKLLVYGVIAVVLTVVSSVLSIIINKLVISAQVDDQQILDAASFGSDGTWTVLGRLVIYAVLIVMISTGAAYLVRSTAAGIAALLLWKLVVEGVIVGLLPKINEWFPPYMPFQNMESAIQLQDMPDAPWGQNGSVLYFAAFCVIVFIAGVITLKKRDA